MMIDRISSFRMVRIVSDGEKGALLHAVSEKSGERVAVRIVRGATRPEELEQRYARAVQVARLLAHPAVVRLVQAGRLPDDSVYVIQEQLIGETLAARLGSRPRLPMNEVLRLARQVATVLAAAHARGVIHRALRPEAVHLVPDPEAIGGERIKLNDWGLAQTPAQGDIPLEAPPVPLDPPTYLAPELCRTASSADPSAVTLIGGGSGVVDRIDVYALGVLLFQMATGQPPFAGRPASEVIAMHVAALPPKLEQKSIAMPAGLPPLVAAMLIKDPRARPTMHEVEERLQQLLSQQQLANTLTPRSRATKDELAVALPSTNDTIRLRSAEETGSWRRPRRRTLAIAFALPVVFVVGLWWLFAPFLAGPPPHEPIVEVPAAKVQDDLARLRGARPPAPVKGSPGTSARPSETSKVRYPPLRDALAIATARVRYPPLRDAKAVALRVTPRRRR